VTTTTPIIYTNCFFKRTATGVFPKAVPSKFQSALLTN